MTPIDLSTLSFKIILQIAILGEFGDNAKYIFISLIVETIDKTDHPGMILQGLVDFHFALDTLLMLTPTNLSIVQIDCLKLKVTFAIDNLRDLVHGIRIKVFC